ncbi:MAG: S8 family serine peptidase [Candidatus Heimdallarchaeota archaeon]|nr:MAG: S8 family serine peptidase [Candidatus Heimdallarchaeota archaeon]
MFARINSVTRYNHNLTRLHAIITQIQSKIIAITFIVLFGLSVFSLFHINVVLGEKDSTYHSVSSLESKKSFIFDTISINQENNVERNQNLIDIKKMRKDQLKLLDKNTNQIADNLEKRIQESSQEKRMSIIVTTKTNEFQGDVLLFEAYGGVIRHIWDNPDDIIYGFSGEIHASKVKEFSEQVKSNIELIEENIPTMRNSDVATHLAMIRTHVWDNLNYTGDPNVAIAVLDTGIDDTHLAFSPGYQDQNWSKKIVGWYDATADGSTTPEDFGGHGSHVAGIVAANEYNNSYDDERIVSTWSYSYDPGQSAAGAFVYIIWVNRTGTIDISYVWQGESSAEGTNLKLYAPNGTLMASNTSGNSNMTVSRSISSEEDFGYWEVALGVSWGVSGGQLDIAGVNKYPYPEPTANYSRFSGVAPEAKLVGVKIFNKTGSGTSVEVINAFNWIKNNKATYHIAVASGSFSSSGTVVSVDSAAAALVNSGVTVVLSAGNDGQGTNSIFSPGQVDGVITVGATDDFDRITSYSSEGPGKTSNTTKPDIVAPGGERTQGAILQVDSNDADSKNSSWSDKIANDFTNIQGTSMSCPFVSGSIALLIQALGGYNYWENGYGSATNPFKVKQLILMTANEIYLDNRGGKDVVEGYGRLNIYAAIEAIENSYEIGTKTSGVLSFELGKRKVWAQNVTLTTGTNYTFVLTVPDGADFDLFLYEADPNQFGEPVVATRSTNFEIGADEYITYTPEVSGVYYLVVKSSFANQGSGTFNLTSTSGSDYPVVSIVSPSENEELSGEYTVQISALDSDLKAVYLKVADDTWINTTYTGTYYEYDYNTTALPDGNFSFVAKAVDSQGHITFLSVRNSYTDNFNQPILLVDDDTGQDYEKYYTRTLHRFSLQGGIGYDYHSVQALGSPSDNLLKQYQLVIWFTSTDSSTTLTATDQNNIISYLDSGGYLWISGQDIGQDIAPSSFYSNYLHANYDGDTVVDNIYVSGVVGDLFDKKRYYVGGGAGSGHHESPSDITANTGASTILNYENDSDYGAAIKYSGTHKVMYFAFNWEAIDDEIDRMDCLNLSLNWFNLDKRPTSVSITNPKNGTLSNQNPTFLWSGTDDYGIEKYTIFRDGIYLKTTTETTLTLNDQPEGWHSYRIVGSDGKNQSQADMIFLFVDTTPPIVGSIISPMNKTYSTPFIPIYVTNQSAVHAAWYRYKNGSWSGNYSLIYDTDDDRWEAEVLRWSDGKYLVQIFFNDSVGNEATIEEWFSVNTTSPDVTIISPSNITYTSSNVDVFASNTSRVHTAWFRYRNGSWSGNYSLIYDSDEERWRTEGLTWSDGYYQVQVFFNNSAGYEAFDQEWFTVDTSAPIVIINTPLNSSYDRNSVWLSYSVSDGDVTIYIDGLALSSEFPDGLTLSDLLDGAHNITIVAIDEAGNRGRDTVIFTVDTLTPTINIINPTNTQYVQNNIQLIYTVSEGVVTIYIDGIANTTAVPSESYISDLSEGSHNITIVAIDSAGNIRKVTVIFTVGTIPTTTVPEIPSTTHPIVTPTSTFQPITDTTTTTTQSESTKKRGSGFLLIEVFMMIALIGILVKRLRSQRE